MTSKDYERIAAALRWTRPADDGGSRIMQWRTDADEMTRTLAAGNPRFDRARFERAMDR